MIDVVNSRLIRPGSDEFVLVVEKIRDHKRSIYLDTVTVQVFELQPADLHYYVVSSLFDRRKAALYVDRDYVRVCLPTEMIISQAGIYYINDDLSAGFAPKDSQAWKFLNGYK